MKRVAADRLHVAQCVSQVIEPIDFSASDLRDLRIGGERPERDNGNGHLVLERGKHNGEPKKKASQSKAKVQKQSKSAKVKKINKRKSNNGAGKRNLGRGKDSAILEDKEIAIEETR